MAGPGPGPIPGPDPGPMAGPGPGPIPGPMAGPGPGPIPGPMAGPGPGPIPGPITGPGPIPGPGPDPIPIPIPIPGSVPWSSPFPGLGRKSGPGGPACGGPGSGAPDGGWRSMRGARGPPGEPSARFGRLEPRGRRRQRRRRGAGAVVRIGSLAALAPGGPRCSRPCQLGLDALRRVRVDDGLLALHLDQPGQLGLAIGVGLVALLGDRDAVVAGHLAGRILLIVRGVQALGHQAVAPRQPGPGDPVAGGDLERGGEAGARPLHVSLREGRAAVPHQRHRLLRGWRPAGRHARSCRPARGLWSREDFTGRGPLARGRAIVRLRLTTDKNAAESIELR